MAKTSTERSRIDVIVRKRPLSEVEKARGDIDVVLCNDSTAIIEELKLRIDGSTYIDRYEFRVDRFYDEHADNQVIYEEYVKPLVEFAFEQQKTCSCFTYGQTGSGKTFTMIGSRKLKFSDQPYMPGIYEYAANDIYRMLQQPEYADRLEVVISFYEIYCGKLYDLLQDRKLLEALDNGKREVIIKDLTVRQVTCKEDLIAHMLKGLALRKIGQNSQNDQSSRSHALLRIELRDIETMQNCGRIAFIDLAGSERGADCMNQPKQTQMDGAGINRSLLALKECIRAMDLEKTHIPFRDSELTKVLRDIFVGGSRNLMIANICPSNVSCEQTLNTLRYASRVKNFRQTQSNGSGGDTEMEHINAFKTQASIPMSNGTRVLRSQLGTPQTTKSMSITPRFKNTSVPTTKSPITQKVSKSRTTGVPLSSRSAVTRRMCDSVSHTETVMSAREPGVQLYDRSKGSRLPKPYERIAPFLTSQYQNKQTVQEVLDDITLDPTNESLYNVICGSLTSDADTADSDSPLTQWKLEKSLDTLKRAEEINNHIALKIMALNGDPQRADYLEFLRNKIKMQVKPLLFLKQAIEDHNNLMQVDTTTDSV
ncbi:Kinesin-like protein KIF24 [Babesia sp. Xinjiang]|uniref:Kinesin-like protein KIF24 n=1 Tax=Babesia sp. Xinjiang TaxID=462227 RepID=UPI000A24BE29|nr:Kinesin-like protein KIF24 [Babesia sp. Xinjiang]XP_028871461.1 Kinesin-like protein KIF24 [Babesia sp. Xinjiang]ORM40940.1 Kinesin-like protein KIF24 [Babesia sp. Xinjiang]ORM41005.1 Kinesin-like protein KIF24 [Babesia sp. Xinjiang]